MPVSAEQMRELMALGIEGETLLKVVTIFERDASRDGRDGKALAAERARRFRARQAQKKRGMASPESDTSRHAERHVTRHVTERDAALTVYPHSLPLLSGKEESKEESTTASVVEGRKRGKRRLPIPLPDDWQPTPAHFEAAQHLALARDVVEWKAEDMRVWAKSNDVRKPDWNATFHGFLRRAASEGKSNGQRGPRAFQDDRLSVTKAIDRRLIEAENGELRFPPRPRLLPEEREDDRRLLPPR